MRLLLDSCVWGGARSEFVTAGHDVVWTGDWSENPGDDEILGYALRERRVLVTLDKDFGELAVLQGRAHAGIVRLVNWRAPLQAAACLEVLRRYAAELEAGALVTAEPGRVRVRLA